MSTNTTYHSLVRESDDDYRTPSVTDRGSRAGSDVSLWIPSGPNGWSWMGMVGVVGYPTVPGVSTWIYQDQTSQYGSGLTEATIVAPTSFTPAWVCDHQSTSHLGIYTLNAPLKYRGLGVVAVDNYNTPPQLSDFPGLVCVHESLCTQVQLSVANGDRIWTDQGSNAAGDISLWRLPTAQVVVALTGTKNYYPDTFSFWDLDPTKFGSGGS